VYDADATMPDGVGMCMCACVRVRGVRQVRPELVLGTFDCLECRGVKAKNVVQQFKYTEPLKCSDARCGNRLRWKLDNTASRFVDWQKVRVQESTDEIPAGSMPRSLDVFATLSRFRIRTSRDALVRF
jgi:DNA replication licensing factor MCM6